MTWPHLLYAGLIILFSGPDPAPGTDAGISRVGAATRPVPQEPVEGRSGYWGLGHPEPFKLIDGTDLSVAESHLDPVVVDIDLLGSGIDNVLRLPKN